MPTNWYQYISVIHHELAESRIRCGMEKLEEVQEPVEWQQGQHPHLGSVLTRARNKGYPKVCEDFTITDIGALSWLKAPTSVFTFKRILRNYARQAFKNGK